LLKNAKIKKEYTLDKSIHGKDIPVFGAEASGSSSSFPYSELFIPSNGARTVDGNPLQKLIRPSPSPELYL